MAPIAPSGTPIVVGRFKKPAEPVFTAGPEHAITYTWQLASNVAIIYPDSRFIVHHLSRLLNECLGQLATTQSPIRPKHIGPAHLVR
jgi:hypothetical protein